MKKLFIIFAALAALTSCSNVSTQNDDPDSNSVGSSVVDSAAIKDELLLKTNCYKAEKFTLPDNMTDISSGYRLKDGNVILNMHDAKFTGKYYVAASDLNEFKVLSYESPEEKNSADDSHDMLFFLPDGSFFLWEELEDHGGVRLPEEYDESFDYDSYNSDCKRTYLICRCSADGKIISKNKIEYPEELFDEEGYLYIGKSAAFNGELLQSFQDGSVRKINPEGNVSVLYKPDDSKTGFDTMPILTSDRDGMPIAIMSTENRETNEYEYSYFEITENGLSDVPLYTTKNVIFPDRAVFGTGEYRLLIPETSGLTAIEDDGTAVTAIDWNASSLGSMLVYPADDGTYIGRSFDSDSNGIPAFVKLVQRDMSELEETQIITIACNYDYGNDIINSFNNSQTKYRVEMIKYPDTYYEYIQQLNLDLASGKAPDIIARLSYDDFVNYANKGAFEELGGYFDSELGRDMILPNIISALERKDGLYCLCQSFNINTLITKTSINSKENWSFDDMRTLYDNAPASAEHLYDSMTKIDMLRMLNYTISDSIDLEKASCDLNNSEFTDILEFCNRFEDDLNEPSKADDSYESFSREKQGWFGNNKIYIRNISLNNFSELNLEKMFYANGEDLTIAGYPSKSGKGGRIIPDGLIAVNSSCANKEAAWEFIKYYILKSNEIKDPQNDHFYIERIPILSASLEKAMELDNAAVHSAGGNTIPPYTEEEEKMLLDYIKSCDTVGVMLDDEIGVIIEEEAGLFFAGEHSSQSAAENIQNRLSILLSEKA